jgi:colanic acid/amylovoran biosynthesis protein
MTAAARPTKAIRKIVIFNVFGHLNMGDAMLLEALVDLLRETFPEATIEGLAFDLKSQEQWMPDIRWHQRIATKTGSSRLRGTIVQAISLPVALAIALSRHFAFLRFLLPARQRQGLDALAEADLAISCPGGYLEDRTAPIC